MATSTVTSKRRLSLSGVPVLMYHALGENLGHGKYGVSPAQFRGHLQVIRDLGFEVVTLDDVVAGTAPERAVVLTFDDGISSDYEVAFPALQEAGMVAEFFVSTAKVGHGDHVTWTQMAEMHRAGMRFGSHGHDHVPISTLPPKERTNQLRESRTLLEQHLGSAVHTFSVPFGAMSEGVRSAAVAVGLSTVCTSCHWPAQRRNPVVNRAAIYRDTDNVQLARLLLGAPLPYLLRRVRAAALYLPKQALLRLRPTGPHNRLGETQA